MGIFCILLALNGVKWDQVRDFFCFFHKGCSYYEVVQTYSIVVSAVS